MVNASWHPNRATCAVSVGRSVYLLDGATGAVLHSARTPIATLALAHAPANLGARLCALLRDGSLHAVDFEDATRAAADAARAADDDETARAAGVGALPFDQLLIEVHHGVPQSLALVRCLEAHGFALFSREENLHGPCCNLSLIHI